MFKAISIVTVHKYLRGIHYFFSHNKKMLRIKLEKAEAELARFEILPYTYEIAKRAAEIDAALAPKWREHKLLRHAYSSNNVTLQG